MKILYVVHQYPPEFVGGVEVYTQGLAETIAQRGWQVAVFHRSYSRETLRKIDRHGAISVFSISVGALSPAQRFLSTWRQPAISEFWETTLAQFKPDVVHVQHLMGLPTTLLERLTQLGIPYVITLHDYWWICANANLLTNYSYAACQGPRFFFNCTHCAVARSGNQAMWAASPLLLGALFDRSRRLTRLLRGAARLLSPSAFVRNWYGQHGVPKERIQIARLGIALPPLASRHKPGGEGIRLLYVGGLAPNKGVHILIEALRPVQGDLQLAVVGDTTTHSDYVESLRRMADERVVFLGKADRAGVWKAFADADAVAVPSLWHETFCLVAHEALAAGIPVLASAMGALPEVIQNGVNGLLLPPGDVRAWSRALQRLVDQPHELETMRSQNVRPVSFEEHAGQIEALYREIVESCP